MGASLKPDIISSASKRTLNGSALLTREVHSAGAIDSRPAPPLGIEKGTPKQPAIPTKLNRWAASKSDAPQGISPRTCDSLPLSSLT